MCSNCQCTSNVFLFTNPPPGSDWEDQTKAWGQAASSVQDWDISMLGTEKYLLLWSKFRRDAMHTCFQFTCTSRGPRGSINWLLYAHSTSRMSQHPFRRGRDEKKKRSSQKPTTLFCLCCGSRCFQEETHRWLNISLLQLISVWFESIAFCAIDCAPHWKTQLRLRRLWPTPSQVWKWLEWILSCFR